MSGATRRGLTQGAPPAARGGRGALGDQPSRCRSARPIARCGRPWWRPARARSRTARCRRVTVADDQSMTARERTNSLVLPGLPAGAPAIVHGPRPVSKPSASSRPAGGRDPRVVDEQPGAARERVAHVGDRDLDPLAGVGRQVERGRRQPSDSPVNEFQAPVVPVFRTGCRRSGSAPGTGASPRSSPPRTRSDGGRGPPVLVGERRPVVPPAVWASTIRGRSRSSVLQFSCACSVGTCAAVTELRSTCA